MSESCRIPTPLSQRLRRVQRQLLPVLVFAGSVALTAWLWGRHVGLPQALGEAGTIQVNAAGPADGRPSARPGAPPEVFDTVQAADVIARLDPGPSSAGPAALQGDRERLKGAAQTPSADLPMTLEPLRAAIGAQEARLGGQGEQVPLDPLGDQKRPERGWPVRMPLPTGMELRPGE